MALERAEKKNTAGSWVRREVLTRVMCAVALATGALGFLAGLVFPEVTLFSLVAEERKRLVAAMSALGGVALIAGVLLLYLRRLEITWLRGFDAERRVGDLIEHALTQSGCAFAHDVKEALGGNGNVDHIAMTPTGLWVIETKARWLSKRRFADALRQTATNVKRVRGHVRTDLPVRGALVIADPALEGYESENDWRGEPIMCLDTKSLWLLLRKERQAGMAVDEPAEVARVRELVWNLGSVAHVDVSG